MRAAGQPVPCDVDKCPYDPSPGDTSEKGCGLAYENHEAVWFYSRWKQFGELAMTFCDLQFTQDNAEIFLDKLMVIDEYIPRLQEATARRDKRRKK